MYDCRTAGEKAQGYGLSLRPKVRPLYGLKMVLPFERQPLLHKRYSSLSSPDLTRSYAHEKEDVARGEEYANFLK